MINHTNRTNTIYIFSLDNILAQDVLQRLSDRPHLKEWQIITPSPNYTPVKPDDLELLAKNTTTARILILDVRRQTMPMLQHVYNKVVGYNRADFNQLCFTVLIGDGPTNLFKPGTSINVFVNHLAKMRIDYSPAAFFYDPFLHYSYDELSTLGIDNTNQIPQEIPKRLARAFKKQNLSTADIRSYFRAEFTPSEQRKKTIQKRRKKLLKLIEKRIELAFPNEKHLIDDLAGPQGLLLQAEPLRLHLYPFHFERWITKLAQKATQTTASSND